jgi:thiol-disulfide isomerase/thioredoxin
MNRRLWLGQVPVAGAPQEIGDAGFSQALSAPKAVVMFFSPNCPYSRAFLPIYQAIAPQTPGVFFATVNVDQSVQNAGTYKVQMLPTVVFLASGKEVGRIDGVQEQGDFLATMGQSFSGAAPAAAAPGTPPPVTAGCPLVTVPPSGPSPVVWGLGAAGVTAALGTAAYFLFLRK